MKNGDKHRFGRREFLRMAGSTAVSGATLSMAPASALASENETEADFKPRGDGQQFWRSVGREFVLNPRSVYMNVGTTGSMPRQVLRRYQCYNRLVARDPWDMGEEVIGIRYSGRSTARLPNSVFSVCRCNCSTSATTTTRPSVPWRMLVICGRRSGASGSRIMCCP